jgi:serine/threonine-protein kinase
MAALGNIPKIISPFAKTDVDIVTWSVRCATCAGFFIDLSRISMPDRDPTTTPERSSQTGAWHPSPAPMGEAASLSNDPPTVIRATSSNSNPPVDGSGPGSAPGPGAAAGSHNRREVASGSGPKTAHDSTIGLPHPGDQLNSFLLQEAIGVGGMGAVFRAHDADLDRTVAIKILPPEQARDTEALQRFTQEGRAAARLDHENIARVYSIGHTSQYHYIAFEYIEGLTLRQKVEANGVFSVADAINLTLQMANALIHANERGVVHRDVKPSNIIVTAQGRAKLVDMGLARRFERGGDTGLTQTGMTLGTFDYISPEQARDPRSVDVRSDLYSLGCTLYYMLAGRPPFPDGTVLQKLLQHQEETPPDVREVNPHVPVELSKIIQKLMAKDRDRRFQSPEQLILDLYSVAGALKLRSQSADGLVFVEPKPRPKWERHVVWAIPVGVFGLFIAGLIWSNQQGDKQPAMQFRPELTAPTASQASKTSVKSSPTNTAVTSPAPSSKSNTPERTTPQEVLVRDSDDLSKLIATSPAGTTLLLVDEGNYEIRPEAIAIKPNKVVVKAGLGLRPILRLAADSSLSKTAAAILDLSGGQLTIEGVEFQLDSDERDSSLAAVRSLDCQLKLNRCVFRRVGTKPGRGATTGVLVRRSAANAESNAPSEVMVDASHFEGGQSAIDTEGPVELTVRDVTMGLLRRSPINCVNKQDKFDQPATLRFNRLSILAGDSPVISVLGKSPRIRFNESIVSPSVDGEVTLISAENPITLDWVGRDNLYAKVSVYLEDQRADADQVTFPAIRTIDAWKDDPNAIREAGSVATSAHIWLEADPAANLVAQLDDASSAFRLSEQGGVVGRFGSKRGPSGSEAAKSTEIVLVPPGSTPSTKSASPTGTEIGALAKADLTGRLKNKEEVGKSAPNTMPDPLAPVRDPGDEQPTEMPPPMEVEKGDPKPGPMPTVVPSNEPTVTNKGASRPPAIDTAVGPFTKDTSNVESVSTPKASPALKADVLIRTSAQFLKALAKSDPKGETIRLAPDATLDLPSCLLKGTGNWLIKGEPGKKRPRITFKPQAGEVRLSEAWTVWMSLLSGSLRLERVDLVLAKDDAPRTGNWGAFAVSAGADLSLHDCTVTIEGSSSRSAVIVGPTRLAGNENGENNPKTPATTVRLKDGFFRSSGDLLDFSSEQKLDLEIENAVIATTGCLLRGHGRTKGISAESFKVNLRHLTTRNEGGLVHLDSTEREPELPSVDLIVRDSVLSTNGKGVSLVTVDGQSDPETLQDRVKWDGNGIVYHQISTYRRDQVLKPGEFPMVFDRNSWELANGRRETGSIHGNSAIFATEWPADRAAWTAQTDDLKLRPESAAAKGNIGTDLKLVPEPPSLIAE